MRAVVEARMPYLVQINADGAPIRHWDMAEKPLLVGRGAQADAQILDQYVSRRHFIITPVEGKHFIRDLGARNGTAVNNQPITKAILRPNDRIQAGEPRFVFVDRLEAAQASAALPETAPPVSPL